MAATTSSLMFAAFEESIKETDLSLTHGNLKNGLTNMIGDFKKEFRNLIEKAKLAVKLKLENYSESQLNYKIPPVDELKKSIETVKKNVHFFLSVSVNLSELHISESENKMVEPSNDDTKTATLLLKNAFFKPLPKIPEEKELFKDHGNKFFIFLF